MHSNQLSLVHCASFSVQSNKEKLSTAPHPLSFTIAGQGFMHFSATNTESVCSPPCRHSVLLDFQFDLGFFLFFTYGETKPIISFI